MQHFSRPDRAYVDFDFPRSWDNTRGCSYIRSPKLRPLFTVLRMQGLRPSRGTILMERTAHGWHVIIQLRKKLSDAEMVALQMCLGDDRKRGSLNLMRARGLREECDGVTPSVRTRFWKKRFNILFSGKIK